MGKGKVIEYEMKTCTRVNFCDSQGKFRSRLDISIKGQI